MTYSPELIEAVARAATMAAYRAAYTVDQNSPAPELWTDEYWSRFTSQATAAITATLTGLIAEGMPTEAMLWAGDEAAQTCMIDDPCGKAGKHVFTDMISALIEEGNAP